MNLFETTKSDSDTAEESYKNVKEAKGLSIGQLVPMFVAEDQSGESFDLRQALNEGPVVIIFYRGQWCPFCNSHLSKLNANLEAIYEKGAQVVAVSPETSAFLKRTVEKTNAAFRLLHDADYKIAEGFDVSFLPGIISRTMVNTVLRANLKEAHSDDSQRLPIPATFVVGKNGKVAWRHFDPDYKKRSSVKDILKALDKL
jgi:peroxiredoxin